MSWDQGVGGGGTDKRETRVDASLIGSVIESFLKENKKKDQRSTSVTVSMLPNDEGEDISSKNRRTKSFDVQRSQILLRDNNGPAAGKSSSSRRKYLLVDEAELRPRKLSLKQENKKQQHVVHMHGTVVRQTQDDKTHNVQINKVAERLAESVKEMSL